MVDFTRYFQVTLLHRIKVQDQIYVQAGKFLKNIKSAGQNRRAGGQNFWKINKCAVGNKRADGNFVFKILINI